MPRNMTSLILRFLMEMAEVQKSKSCTTQMFFKPLKIIPPLLPEHWLKQITRWKWKPTSWADYNECINQQEGLYLGDHSCECVPGSSTASEKNAAVHTDWH